MLIAILCALLLNGADTVHTSDYYTAAVLEHIRFDDPADRPAAVQKNLDVLQQAAEEAGSLGADIIVYPEEAILPVYQMTPILMEEYYEAIPDPLVSPLWTPCQNPNSMDFPVLTRLSCVARNNGMYVVANVGGKEPCSPQKNTRCPYDIQTLFYNTEVVFDSNGTHIARHRKRFLFLENNITRPETPNYAVFNTSFGSFAVIICFEATFVEAVDVIKKFQVENMVISANWVDELPFGSALQSFQSFAIGNRVNVLAANIHEPSLGTIGSLIASGQQGTLAYTFEPDMPSSKLLVARVPRVPSYRGSVDAPMTQSLEGYQHANIDVSNFNLTKLEDLAGFVESCNNGLCCHLNYTSNTRPEDFYLGAFSGIGNINHHFFYCQELCILALCTSGTKCTSFPTHSEVGFESLSLSGNIQTPHQYPGVMASEMTLVPYEKWDFSPGHLTFRDVQEPLLSVTIQGRCYDKDPPPPDS